jgi:dephospho-CoA kinase
MMKDKNKRATLIAITGGIASGKSAVSAWLEEHGSNVVYSDKIGHEVLKMPKVEETLIAKFGKDILADNKISRKKLAKLVFSKPDNLLFLNNLTHPLIREQMQKIADNCEDDILFFEIPLLYEDGLSDKFDYVINVFSTEDVKIARIKERDNLDEEAAKMRIKAQLPDYIKFERADISLLNNGSLEDLYRQLENIKDYFTKLPQKKIKRMV